MNRLDSETGLGWDILAAGRWVVAVKGVATNYHILYGNDEGRGLFGGGRRGWVTRLYTSGVGLSIWLLRVL